MEFKCNFCDFETDDEDVIIYCNDCGNTMCEEHTIFIEHQGFQEAICKKCKNR